MISSHLAVQGFKKEVGCLQSVYRYHIVVGPEVNDKVFVIFGYDGKWLFVRGAMGGLYVFVRIYTWEHWGEKRVGSRCEWRCVALG